MELICSVRDQMAERTELLCSSTQRRRIKRAAFPGNAEWPCGFASIELSATTQWLPTGAPSASMSRDALKPSLPLYKKDTALMAQQWRIILLSKHLNRYSCSEKTMVDSHLTMYLELPLRETFSYLTKQTV